MTSDLLARLEVFYGELTVNRAYIYARLPRPEGEGWSLAGQVRGPRCLHAQTLPVSEPFVDKGPGPTLLSRALVPDPCFWSPDLPAIYDVTLQLIRGDQIVATARRELGLRMLGIRGRNLFLDGKRWVLRGVATHSTTERLPRAWHDASAAYVCNNFDFDRLSEASQWGALTAVHLDCPTDQSIRRLVEVTKFPGAAIAVISRSLPATFEKSLVAPNLLLAQSFKSQDIASQIAPWADLLVASADQLHDNCEVLSAVKPVIAARHLGQPLSLSQARAACDALQRELAPLGQFAGYIV